ncbi:hypothetical protein CsSME_00010094 [Camellia sinensis var. sinensis]
MSAEPIFRENPSRKILFLLSFLSLIFNPYTLIIILSTQLLSSIH